MERDQTKPKVVQSIARENSHKEKTCIFLLVFFRLILIINSTKLK